MADLGTIGTTREHQLFRIPSLLIRVHCGPTLQTVSGVILDDAGNPCARTVRAVRRFDGYPVSETVSDATTGAYSLPCTVDEVQRLVLDDEAGTLYNDLIDRVIPA
jgi:hypothetical protein